MNYQKLFQQMIRAILVTLLLVGCGAPGATSEQIDLPDLAVKGHRVVFNPGTCGWNGGQITVSLDNIGEADAGPFTVFIEGQVVRLNELPAGSSADATPA
jgi:hypothetical protein